MGELYKEWLDDPDSRQIIEAHNAHQLNEHQQDVFEKLVTTTKGRGNVTRGRYTEMSRALVPPVRNTREAGFLIDSLKAMRDGRRWGRAGTDPHVFEGLTHRKGVDGPN